MRLALYRYVQFSRAFTLVELVVTTAIGLLAIVGTVYGYTAAAARAEWSAFSLAAQSLAVQQLEQARAAKWDPLGYPPTDELAPTNFSVVEMLDIPISGTNIVYATSIVSIANISINPPLRKIQVTCTWSFLNRGVFSNSIATYRAPDQ